MENLENRIKKLEERNHRVEADKAWETSLTRRTILALLTYISIGAYLQAIQIGTPWLNAIVPTIAFMLSTLTLPFFKRIWLKLKNSDKNS